VSKARDTENELKDLVLEGKHLLTREILDKMSPVDRSKAFADSKKSGKGTSTTAETAEGGASERLDEKIKEVARRMAGKSNFKEQYQEWYSKASRAVQQILPDRYVEFRSYYQADRRKDISVSTYVIADYIADLQITEWSGTPVFNAHNVAMRNFDTQINILAAASAMLHSYLSNISAIVQAQLLDDELDSARTLLKAAHIRSSGVVAGVVLETHLQAIAKAHAITIRRNATLSTLNDALRNAGVVDVPTWRKLQYLGDVRNKCAHRGLDDPTKDEVGDMIIAVEKITHTMF
jgi:hypothetical protein